MTRVPCVRSLLILAGLAAGLAGCASHASLSDRECMTRAMYFESNRSSQDGMLAVGTTVMNRLASPGYPKTVCEVVGQRNQYAPGVLDKPMIARESAAIAQVADSVLAGERHPQVGSAMFFHTAGMSFPYANMHYVAVAGGNAFYEKLPPGSFVNTIDPLQRRPAATAFAQQPPATLFDAPRSPRTAVARSRPGGLFTPAPPTNLAALIAKSLGFGDQPRHRRRSASR